MADRHGPWEPASARGARGWVVLARALVALIVMVGVVMAAGGAGHAPSAVAAGRSVAQPTPSVPPPIELSGTGDQVTKPFALTGGLAVLRAECPSCKGNFIVELLDDKQQVRDVVANRVGPYSGSRAAGVQAGDHALLVDADAPWSVEITQPRDRPAAELPQSSTGSGDHVIGPFAADKTVAVRATHSAGNDFAVTVLDAKGRAQDLVFNETGDFDGAAVAQMASAGPYYVNVTADGDWTLELSEP
ncbi:hypothetical protein ACTMTU_07970 [Streptomyces sp. OZ13]|uniref:hypothetical protein n=1 Tax=Streptomyces sp. OZ13 TaxID=3452210 RepID=UPI003F8CC845